MARDGLFFHGIGAVHPRFGTPARAIALQAALASVFIALGSFEEILAYFIFATVLFLGLTTAGLFVLRRRDTAPPPFSTPGYPLTPMIFLVLIVALLALLGAGHPLQAALGVGVVALGVPVYFVLARHHDPPGRTRSP
jgi:APA family basic amino acid/polyamine antiporter